MKISESTSTDFQPSYKKAVTKSGLMTEPDGKANNGNNFKLLGTHNIEVPSFSSLNHDLLPLANLQVNEAKNHNAQNSGLSEQMNDEALGKTEEILFCCDNVLLYFISPDGSVSSTSQTKKLVIARSYGKNDSTFVQVESWSYPLIPKKSHYISKHGFFIFPDNSSEVEGAAVGIVVPNEVQEQFNKILYSILNEDSENTRSRAAEEYYSLEHCTSKIVKGASYIANNLIWGAGATAKLLDSSAPKIIERIDPEPQPKEFGPHVKQSFQVAKKVSGTAAQVSDYLAMKVESATSTLGRYLSPYIQEQGSKLIASTTNMSAEKARENLDSVLNIASNTLEGLSIMHQGLQTAATILARSLSNNTVQIVEHKYGQTAGALMSDALITVGNVFYAGRNFKVLKPKGLTKAAIRGAGNAVLDDFKDSKTKSHEEFEGSGSGSGYGS